MCGIAGTVGRAPPDPGLLEAMAATMAKRGPDGQRTWHDDIAGLAFRRLAVIDLHERSSQPMHLGALHLVFNGEIYNYRELRAECRRRGRRFVTAGDAEVLLHAWDEWGEAALDRLNGMFALAVWDDRTRRLTLASDPFGEKPLYYAHAGDRLVFGSEIGAILCDPAVDGREDRRALEAFVAHARMPPPGASFFRAIARLPAAHVLRWQAGRVEVERWWRPRRVEVPRDYGTACAALRDVLADSVRLRLSSDVPVGTSLSGGVDSSAVVMLAAALAGEHRRHAFTARFRGYERDEWAYASAVAAAAGVERHHAVEPAARDLLDDLPMLVRDHEEPVESLSIYAQWSVDRAARRAGVVVLLDGQGGDELLAGYPAAAGLALRSAGAGEIARSLARRPRAAAGAMVRATAKERLGGPLRAVYRRRTASPYAAPGLAPAAAARETPPAGPWASERDPLRRERLTECFVSSLPRLLRYADRSSMAHGREVRLPFLDRRVAELALSLPASYLHRGAGTKAILRDAVRGAVPELVLARRDKVAFEPPQARWLAEPALRGLIGEVLLDRDARDRGLYDTVAIEADARAGRWRDAGAIWTALNAELWLHAVVRERRPRGPDRRTPVPAAAAARTG
jgi:asparagine synthase (glutamine-hydrolysing)